MDFPEFKKFVLWTTKDDDKYYKIISERYPFLIPTNAWSGKIEDYDYSYLIGFWHNGWKELFLTYCEKVKPEFDKLIFETRSKLGHDTKAPLTIEELNKLRDEGLSFITDCKEKYGTCRVYWSSGTTEMHKAESIIDMLSSVTCMRCGKVPRTSDGRHLIWQTRGWITNYCKDCLEKNYTSGGNVKKSDRKDFKKYRDSCRIAHSKYFVIESWGRDSHTKTFYKDTNDGWLEVDHVETIEEK